MAEMHFEKFMRSGTLVARDVIVDLSELLFVFFRKVEEKLTKVEM